MLKESFAETHLIINENYIKDNYFVITNRNINYNLDDIIKSNNNKSSNCHEIINNNLFYKCHYDNFSYYIHFNQFALFIRFERLCNNININNFDKIIINPL